uniref:Uncharacterized protein n=1 Tax=Tanacetum cinerariifolium TaxID=118510 RepID=A0A6L2LWS9_TANCI|nr:hypothetical protein [Tanacetum cinerariifolium]
MIPIATQQAALNNALVPSEKRLKIERCIARIAFSKPQREETYQVTLDALKLSPCYPVFHITAEVPKIYMHQFWNTIKKIGKTNEEDLLTFIKELGYSGKCDVLSTIRIDQMHQPWRTFDIFINKCISRKTTGLDRLRESRAQILWAMYNQINVDYVALLWEDFMYQADNIEISSARKEHIPYLRFTKVIIHYFISKDNTISMRNRINLHTVCDDTLLGTLKFVSKTKDYQKYGALIPNGMINQDIKESKAYKIYLDYATRKVPYKKARNFKKPASPKLKIVPVSPKEPTQKGKRVKRPAKKANASSTTGVVISNTPDKSVSKKKAPAKADRDKDIELLFDAALLEDAQLKKTLRKSKRETHKLQASGSTEGANFESEVPDEPTGKTKDASEGTGAKPRVPDVYKEDSSDSDNDYWGDSEDESDDVHDKDGNNDDSGNDDDSGNVDGSNDAEDREQTNSDDDENPFFSLKDYEEQDEDQFAEAVSSVLSIVDNYLASKLKEEVNVAVRLQSNKLKEEFEAESQEFINQLDSTMKKIIKEQVKAEVSKIMPQIKNYVIQSLGAEVLVRSTNQPQTSYAVAASLLDFELKKILIDKIETNESINRLDIQRNLYNALVESYNIDKYILSTYGDVVTLKRGRDDQDKDEDPSVGSDRETKRRKSSKDVEPSKGLNSKESKSSSSSKGTQSQHKSSDQGRQVVPADYFINNDLEYLKGGSSSSKYVTSTTRTKAAKYDNIEGIDDMKKLSNLDVDDRYDLGVALRMFTRRIVILYRVEDLHLGVESYQKKLNITRPETFRSDISNMIPYTAYKNPQVIIYQDKFQRNRLMRSDELYKFGDGMLLSVRTMLHDIASSLEMDYLLKRHWSNLEKKRSRIMIKAIDKMLFERMLMRNLEKFVGGREYGNDLRQIERTI